MAVVGACVSALLGLQSVLWSSIAKRLALPLKHVALTTHSTVFCRTRVAG